MGTKKEIVILGAGYGGLVTAIRLQKILKPHECEVTLVNKNEYHHLTTQLHMPAAGTKHDDAVRIQLTSLIDTSKIRFVRSSVTAILPEERAVYLENRILTYDYLVVALGSEPETFGIPGLSEHAMTISSIEQVQRIRQHIENSFAKYKLEPHRKDYLTFVVGGTGLTGSEFVGELADRVPQLCKENGIDPSIVTIYNVEASSTAMPMGLPANLVEYGTEVLKRKGVTYKLSSPIKECTAQGVLLGDGEFIEAATVVWSGGVRGNRLLEQAGFETVRGRVKVDDCLRSIQYPDVFVIGDCALSQSPDGRPLPASGQVAVQQGFHAAATLAALIRWQPVLPFVYKDRGIVASLGKGEAIGKVGNRTFQGKFAAMIKRLVEAKHLFTIGGIRLVIKRAFM